MTFRRSTGEWRGSRCRRGARRTSVPTCCDRACSTVAELRTLRQESTEEVEAAKQQVLSMEARLRWCAKPAPILPFATLCPTSSGSSRMD